MIASKHDYRTYIEFMGFNTVPIDHDKLRIWNHFQKLNLEAWLTVYLFDFALQSGYDAAIKKMQNVLFTKPDGEIGLETKGRIYKFKNKYLLFKQLMTARAGFLATMPSFHNNHRKWHLHLQRLDDYLYSEYMREV